MHKEKLTFYVLDLDEAVAWYVRELKRDPIYVASHEAYFHTEEADLFLVRENREPASSESFVWSHPVHFSNFDFFSPSPSM